MKLKIFCVYDSKIGAFNNPFFQRSTGEALRSFGDAVNKEENFRRHSEDYVLFELGSFDDQTAAFDLYDAPKSLGMASQFLLPVEK